MQDKWVMKRVCFEWIIPIEKYLNALESACFL